MVDGVLNYSSMPSDVASWESVDLNEIIRSIQHDLEILITEKKATITYSRLPVFRGIRHLIHQLFYNLINNALKFSKVDVPSVIHIQCDQIENADKTYYQIVLSDNGIGFDDAYAEQIFQTFFRLNSKDKYEG